PPVLSPDHTATSASYTLSLHDALPIFRPWQNSREDIVEVECPVHDRRRVRSSSGHSQRRVVVLLDITLAGRTVPAEVTLTNRDQDRKSTRLNSSHVKISYAVFCLKKKK